MTSSQNPRPWHAGAIAAFQDMFADKDYASSIGRLKPFHQRHENLTFLKEDDPKSVAGEANTGEMFIREKIENC
ncbi:MAG: hypothetical protein KBD54_00520 [Candidatus Pacebacteria bacterium]|jgi:hypothetical protein|nr:hypothetical protein [Candidatus Paceibacterota bacterium]